MLMTITAYAATHNARRQAATKWLEKSALVMVGGKVDAEASDALMRGRGLGRFRSAGHGGRRAAGVHGVADRPAVADIQKARQARYDAAYPSLAQVRDHSPPKLATMMETALGGQSKLLDHLDDGLLDLVDLLAWSECENDAQAGEWHRWPGKIAVSLAAEIGAPDKAGAIETGLRSRIVARLEHELMIDPEIYLATADQASCPAPKGDT